MRKNTWLDGVVLDFINKNKYYGTLTEKQVSAFTHNMDFKSSIFYGKTHTWHEYTTVLNNESVTFKVNSKKFTIQSDSINAEYEKFKNNNEIAKVKDIIKSLESKIQNNPDDERTKKRKAMLERIYKELEKLTK